MRLRTQMVALVIVTLLACLALGQAAAAQAPAANPPRERQEGEERMRWMLERRGAQPAGRLREFQQRTLESMMRRIETGTPVGPDQERWLERHLVTHLLRLPSMNAVESAHYAVAEIYLNRGEHMKCLERLQTVLDSAGNRQDDVVWVTHLNIANICRRQQGDVQRAIREYKLVKGTFAGFAQRELLRTLEEMGELDEAVAILEKEYDAAMQKGEKLALLTRIAETYVRNNEEEKAIAVYDRIVAEFTAADIEEMRKAAADYVKKNAEKVIALREAGRFDEAERTIQETHRRLDTLRAQGRGDEARAMEEILPEAMEKIEQWEREHLTAPQRPQPEVPHADEPPKAP